MYTVNFIGIDPGKLGSVSVLSRGTLYVFPTPLLGDEYDASGMVDLLGTYKDQAFCLLERAQAMPGQGVVSMFTFGKGYGMWLMALAALKIPYQIVHARTWTKVMLEGAPGEGKERSYVMARRLFPSWDPKKKKEHEYSDSMLLAEYGRRLQEKK